MTTQPDPNAVCKAKIADLLSNYEEGWNILKRDLKPDPEIDVKKDWDYPVTLKPSSQQKGLPQDWLGVANAVFAIIAKEKYNLDTYPNQIEIITADQMMDLYATVGIPVHHRHWSIGMERIQTGKNYEKGRMGLAYEIVINTNPSIVYVMEGNSPTMQLLVIAHAGYGHNSFFKGNNLFTRFTKADIILDEFEALKNLVELYGTKYGVDEVEEFLDSCNALESYAVDRYTKPAHRSVLQIKADLEKREAQRQKDIDPVLDRLVNSKAEAKKDFREASIKAGLIPERDGVNIMRFMAENSPFLKDWQREIMLLKCRIAQYFYPQRQTQVGNEGWASRTHYKLMNDLYDMQLINEGMMIEFLKSHTGVLFQPEFDDKHKRYSGFNPYALGFAIYEDIERICTNPTDEDKQFFPHFAGNNKPLETVQQAMEESRDESLILNYLSPHLIRKFRLFAFEDDDKKDKIEIAAIHDENGYRRVRELLAAQYDLNARDPEISAYTYDWNGDRSLTLVHRMHNRRPLNDDASEMMKHVHRLWGKDVYLHSIDEDGDIFDSYACPPDAEPEKEYKKYTPI